ncbi:ATP-binding protein [Flavobacterium succinicans]|uniref:DNA mismatch repair protein n=1 Tax=Flavobacterium succinicans TaxID=29536 RepID=A0A199XTR8_9FLAO|nr:ATP-binding protein [Flavobacterium succinicans]OAZ04822.1 DNA mismatch repair protein [Flavobacterium succinicans]
MSITKHNIKAKSHILTLLGEELIGNDGLAIFELVKNSYDADATEIKVTFVDLNTPNQKIIIEDDGHGMSPNIIENVWLTIGTDFKRGKNRKVSKKFNRVSLGNKGVGRLAVHKLAKEINVETQVEGDLFSSQFYINWNNLIKSKEYIQDLEVEIENVPNTLFEKGHGTRIILSGLVNKNWTKLLLRDLVRKIENIKNPFVKFPNFNIEITANDHHQNWLEGIKTSSEILKDSLYQFDFEIKKWTPNSNDLPNDDHLAEYLWSYNFNSHPHMKIEEKEIKSRPIMRKEHFKSYDEHIINNVLEIGDKLDFIDEKGRKKLLLNSDLNNIGTIKGKFYVFNLTKDISNLFFGGQINAVKEFIRLNYGIKIFRDGIRVYNYGEQTDDWLELDYSKIQHAGSHFARKITIGAIELNLDESENGITEKTNREGFNENYYFFKLKAIVKEVFSKFENESKSDKEKVQEYIDKFKPVKHSGLSETIKELSLSIKDKNLEKELSPLIKRVEKDYTEMRDVMVSSGMTGLNLGVVFHEIDREMRFINVDINKNEFDIENVRIRVKNLIQVLENFSPILKQNQKINIKASELVNKAKNININRFGFHNVVFSSPLLSNENPDFNIFGEGNLLISAISNIIDNSIYWVGNQKDINDKNFKGGIYIGTDLKSFNGNAIIIADNGSGFKLETEELIRAFVTSKPGGMGLGLYYVNLVMEMLGGKIIFPDNSDLDIPQVYNGACIALVFPKK